MWPGIWLGRALARCSTATCWSVRCHGRERAHSSAATVAPFFQLQVIIVGDLNVAASQQDCHYLIKHEKCYNAEELALLSALTSRWGPASHAAHQPESLGIFASHTTQYSSSLGTAG
jgi:hypothetical protein